MAKIKQTRISVSTAFRTANGSFLLNAPSVKDTAKGFWINGSDITNSLVRLGLSPKLPAWMLKGSVVSAEVLTITDEDLAENGGSYDHIIPASGNREERKITYKTPGTKVVSAEVEELSPVLERVSETAAVNMNQAYAEQKTYGRRAAAVVTQTEDANAIVTEIATTATVGNAMPTLED